MEQTVNENIRHEERAGSGRRSISVRAFGDNVDELELSALAAARTYFGDDIPLEIDRSYEVHRVGDGSALAKIAGGKRYFTGIDVWA